MACATPVSYKRKRRSAKQIATANRGRQNSIKSRSLLLRDQTTNTMAVSEETQVKNLEEKVSTLRAKIGEERQKRYTATRRAQRLHKSKEACKLNLKQEKQDAYNIRGALKTLGQENKQLVENTAAVTQQLSKRIRFLEQMKRDQNQNCSTLRKRCKYLTNSNKRLKNQSKLKSHSSVFRMKARRRYSDQARTLARLLVASGTAEEKVGKTLTDIGNVFGIEVRGQMSRRTVQRTVLEKGVAADMQIVYEILKSGST
jgi:hypothetical protein